MRVYRQAARLQPDRVGFGSRGAPNMNQKSLERGVGIGAVLLILLASWATAQAPVREITQIAGEVYRFRNNNHYAVFAVTPQGIIATDPINAEAAQWLKAELQQRFAKPVKYLIYSH